MPGMLVWSSKISTIFIVNSKISLGMNCYIELNEESLWRVGSFFI